MLSKSLNNTRTLKLKSQLRFTFYAAVNHNYDDNHWTLKTDIDKMDRNPPITSHYWTLKTIKIVKVSRGRVRCCDVVKKKKKTKACS